MFIISITLIQLILFCTKGYNSLKERIKKIIQVNFRKSNEVFKMNYTKKINDKPIYMTRKQKNNNSLYSPSKKKPKKNAKIFKRTIMHNVTPNSINKSSKNNISKK